MLENILGNKRYLVIDDFGEMRSTLRSMLSLFGVTDIDNAKNGAEAISSMLSKKYDVVLCDYNLGPGKDGQQVLEEARHRGLISLSTAFLMITAENTTSMVLGAIEFEPDSYLNKPFTKDLLRNRLKKVLTKKLDLQPIDAALERKDYPKALELLDQRIAGNPRNLSDLIRLKGDICIRSGAYEEAAVVFESVLATREMAWARMGLGRVYYGLKRYEAARETFQELINTNNQLTQAYDWLSRSLKALGDLRGSQEVLSTALSMSPRAILRQQELGEIAMENKDFNTAEDAFNQAVNLGKHSIHKHPKIYARLVESKVSNEENNDKQNAFKVIEQMQKEFKGDREADLYAAISKASVHRGLGEEDQALESMARAERLYDHFGAHNNSEITLSMAKINAKMGNEEAAKKLFQTAIKNNHDDDHFLRNVAAALNESGISESAGALISETKKEIIALNNEGVRLVSDNRIEEAIGLFEKAAEGMSGNKAINLNAAKVLIMSMERDGLRSEYTRKTREYLERIKKLDPDYQGLPKLFARLKSLVGGPLQS